MPFSIDNALALHSRALTVAAERAGVLANNMANADTPGYKARDIDFKEVMSGAESAVRLDARNPQHFGGIRSAGMPTLDEDLKYRIPLQPAVDGNTVNAHVEKAEFSTNAIRYSASLGFLRSRVDGLLSAIRGVE